ncbi:IS605 OrfB-like transposable element containing RNAse H-like and Zn finger domain [Methanonatronarchaeum thermophilum]|uniref:IS605 OrfB-like transposable element containing RNAse H-like and Zn finger domain n=1 Tax=Methanonatronarchaeum thermophilum TaxID=1927129 RepID=A0A1Y3GAB1_9EURY|nr:hypothetical protein [Methanonatronarchaeum thermophilum]OUJ18382.1 IS605 OrfB-like transposable element containing RNAse H-like and Zn finger domain [Methanonatronarchaeum thermophilum]
MKHKCEYYEIDFKLVNESHTTKCSFLDGEPVEHHEEYIGTRIERGLFKAGDGTLINADVNGAHNIARRGIGKYNETSSDVRGVVTTPETTTVDPTSATQVGEVGGNH